MTTPSFKYAALAFLLTLFIYPAKAAQSENSAQQKGPDAQQSIQPPTATVSSVNDSSVEKPITPTEETAGNNEQTKPITRAEKIQIVISGLLTLIVLGQLVIYWQQRNIMERAAEYTKIGERAYIGLKAINLLDLEVGKTPRIAILILNGGRTPAWNVSVGMTVSIGIEFPTERPKIKNESNLLPAGIDREVLGQLRSSVTAEMLKEIVEGTAKIFIRGEAHFRDAWRNKRKFNFNLVYRPADKKFGNYNKDQESNAAPEPESPTVDP